MKLEVVVVHCRQRLQIASRATGLCQSFNSRLQHRCFGLFFLDLLASLLCKIGFLPRFKDLFNWFNF
jgi:hypothetical protein